MTVEVSEVGPRDGLQNEPEVLSVATKVAFINRLSDCGFTRIEAVSFVSERRVPQMAGAEEVMATIRRRAGTTYVGLVPNWRGGERALAAGVDRINFAFPVTETFSLRNQGRSVTDTLIELEKVAGRAAAQNIPCTVTLGASFGCPFEGAVEPQAVARLARRAVECGADEISLADTIGVGVPRQVRDLVDAVRCVVPEVRLGAHLHNTRNTGFANAVAAIDAGITFLDASIGGAGGCPFAPKATGNIATEDLLYLLQASGESIDVDIDAVVETALWLESTLGRSLPGAVKAAGVHWQPVGRQP